MAQNIIYKSKEVDFHGEKRNILYPKHGHSRTALLVLGMYCYTFRPFGDEVDLT